MKKEFDELFSIFLSITKELNALNVKPVLYGSLGLAYLTKSWDEFSDIDIVIPNKVLEEDLEKLTAIMSSLGFKPSIEFPHEFTSEQITVGFELESILFKDTTLKIPDLQNYTVKDRDFWTLSLDDYLFFYKKTLSIWKQKTTSMQQKVSLLENDTNKKQNNIAFVDGQNLYMGTLSEGWSIDHKKFRIYLRDKYKIVEAYYFLGCLDENNQDLYSSLQKAGFIVVFREHNSIMKGKKKGNVDTDIVFELMRRLVDENKDFHRAVLVSGDGDYKKVVDYFIAKNKFEKILFPNKEYASSLYKNLTARYFSVLGEFDIRQKIEYKK